MLFKGLVTRLLFFCQPTPERVDINTVNTKPLNIVSKLGSGGSWHDTENMSERASHAFTSDRDAHANNQEVGTRSMTRMGQAM